VMELVYLKEQIHDSPKQCPSTDSQTSVHYSIASVQHEKKQRYTATTIVKRLLDVKARRL
jgi:hypothetical protein